MEIVGYVTTVIVLLFVCGGLVSWLGRFLRSRKRHPKLAGTVIPEIGQGLDVNKRYDIVYSGGDFGSQLCERIQNVRIVGYVGHADDESISKQFMRGRWLVVELADQRRAYLMPHSIISLVESA